MVKDQVTDSNAAVPEQGHGCAIGQCRSSDTAVPSIGQCRSSDTAVPSVTQTLTVIIVKRMLHSNQRDPIFTASIKVHLGIFK